MKKQILIIGLLLLFGFMLFGHFVHQVEDKNLQRGYQDFISDQPGILLEIFNNRKFEDYPQSAHIIQKLELSNDTFSPFDKPTFSSNIKGFFKVPRSGTYTFQLASDDGALLYIDGKQAIDNRGLHPYEAKKIRLHLSKGLHFIFMRYRNEKLDAKLKLRWHRRGEKGKVMGEGDLFLAKNLPYRMNPFPSFLAEKSLWLNHIRFGFLLCFLLTLFLFFKGKAFSQALRNPYFWVATFIFILAFALRYFYYAMHLELRIQGILDGGDNQHFLLLPLRYITNGEFISLQCGNLPILIPLLGTLYKWFHFFPGLHYYALLMIGLGSLVCLFPWLLLRKMPYGWIGLLAGIYLAINPLLINITVPYVTSDLLGYFTFCLAIFFCLKALQDNLLSSYLLAGFGLALLPLSRTVFIPSAPLFMILLVLLAQKKSRALVGLALFFGILIVYDLLARSIIGDSYFIYYLQDGLNATVHHRASGKPTDLFSLLLWLPKYIWQYLQLIFYYLLPKPLSLLGIQIGVLILITLTAITACLKKFRQFFFIFFVAGVYLFEVSSYTIRGRYSLIFIFLLGMILAIGMGEWFKKVSLKLARNLSFCLLGLFLIFSLYLGGSKLSNFLQYKKEQNQFLAWVKKELPEKSILLTDSKIDPWLIHQKTGAPVFFESTLDQTFVVQRSVTPITRVTFLSEQSQIPPIPFLHKPKTGDDFFRHHPYVLDGLAQLGWRYFTLQKDFAHHLENFQFKQPSIMSLNPKHYKLEKFKQDPNDPTKGLWEVKRTRKRLIQPIELIQFKPPEVPKDLDRFLITVKKKNSS